MSEHKITLEWLRTTASFDYDVYNRAHVVEFAGGQQLRCSAAPEYKGDPALANPEETLAAALSSCHMLTFLAIASKKRLVVDSYTDAAVARMAKNAAGKMAIVETTLRPKVVFSGTAPSRDDLETMHHKAHEACFVASSVNFPVHVELG
jgi:organic hydroperoxide reductase OsmC/OhrA